MNCRKAQSWFSKFLDQGLEPGKAQGLMTHLQSCPECSKAWERFRASLRALKELERIEPSSDFEARLWRRIHEAESQPAWRNAWGAFTGGVLWPKLAGAAAVVCIVAGALLVGGVLGPGQGPQQPSVAGEASFERVADRAAGVPRASTATPVAAGREREAVSGWDAPLWAGSRSGRLERDFYGFEGMIDTAGVEPEFVIRSVSYDPSAPARRAF